MRKIDLICVLILMLAVAGFAADTEDSPPELTPEQVQLNLESFDYVWSTINDRHFDTTFGGVDWKAVHEELRPKVESATTMPEARTYFYDLISRLGLSHFGIFPATLYRNIDRPSEKGDYGGQPGFEVGIVDSHVLVTEVSDGSSAAEAGVRPGWEVVVVDTQEVAALFRPLIEEFQNSSRLEFYLARAITSRLGGAIGDTVMVVFRDGGDELVKKFLELHGPAGKKVVFGNFPPFYLRTRLDTLSNGIGYFYFSCFLDPGVVMSAYSDAMQTFMDGPGIIIDVRGNPGGIGIMAVGMANWLIAEKNLYLGTLSTRDTELRFVVSPQAKTFTAPVAVLIDGCSGSTSEIMCQGLQDIGRARLFGSRTVGAALPSLIERLPNGDGFQYAIANYVSASGRVLEGDGVMPDEEVRHTREALLEGRDLVLEAATEWIESQSK